MALINANTRQFLFGLVELNRLKINEADGFSNATCHKSHLNHHLILKIP